MLSEDTARPSPRSRPALRGDAPKQCWSSDITELRRLRPLCHHRRAPRGATGLSGSLC